ncbi:MAG: patatin-like phospholipase family protein [Nitrospirae bacterium]|nr:patatin-like phospholipase family protein [Nitrospirota bacterium]
MALLLFFGACAPKETVKAGKPAAKIAIVLGAGASRGFAHIGALKVLEANRVPVHMIVGTSAGSFVGSLYAYGYDSFTLQKMSLDIEKSDIADYVVPDNGFIKGDKLEEYVNLMVKNTPIEKLRIPFYAITTGIPGGQELVFSKGNTGTAVRASCSIPGIFRPVRIGDRMYVDGGVVSPVAVDTARTYGADIVIAVDISSDRDTKQPESTFETILQSINIMYSKLSAVQLARADVVIRPKVGHIGSADFEKRHEAILEGEKAAYEAMPRIKEILSRLTQEGRL